MTQLNILILYKWRQEINIFKHNTIWLNSVGSPIAEAITMKIPAHPYLLTMMQNEHEQSEDNQT